MTGIPENCSVHGPIPCLGTENSGLSAPGFLFLPDRDILESSNINKQGGQNAFYFCQSISDGRDGQAKDR